MSYAGYVYVLINPSLPGMVKIGKADRELEDHDSEQPSETGVSTPSVVAHQEFFANCAQAEAFVYSALEQKGIRVTNKREFFAARLHDVRQILLRAKTVITMDSAPVKAIDAADYDNPVRFLAALFRLRPELTIERFGNAGVKLPVDAEWIKRRSLDEYDTLAEEVLGYFKELLGATANLDPEQFTNEVLVTVIDKLINNEPGTAREDTVENDDDLQLDEPQPWKDALELADDYYYGLGDTIQDYHEALRLYKIAAKLGSSEACLQLGNMYQDGEGTRVDKRKALDWFKRGVSQGNIECYAEMAGLFQAEDHFENAMKCWDKYFESPGFDSIAPDRKAWHGFLYYSFYFGQLKQRHPLKHKNKLAPLKSEILQQCFNMLERSEKSRNQQGSNGDFLLESRYTNSLINRYRAIAAGIRADIPGPVDNALRSQNGKDPQATRADKPWWQVW